MIPTNPKPANFGVSEEIRWANPIPFDYPNPTSKKNKGIASVKTSKKYGIKNVPPPFLKTTI